MANVFELAPTGRAKCRGCGRPIAKGEIRFGERLPNPFGEGEMTLWFHPLCAAYKRPDAILAVLGEPESAGIDAPRLRQEAEKGLAHRRLPRLSGAEKASSGRASCRACREPIEKGTWRISLVFYSEGRFEPSGFIHVRCAGAYFETPDIVERLAHFSPLDETTCAELASELAKPAP
jgi:hypothetical protein